jgi:hypothetical protein
MGNRLRRWFNQIGIEIRTKGGRGSLSVSFLLWIVVESLRHRFFAAFNEWQDNRKEKAMGFLGKLGFWLVDHPYAWPILVVIAILIHAYWKSQHEKDVPESAEPASFTVGPSDPRITVEFIDERAGQLFKKTALSVVNHGGSEALDVRIEDIVLRAQRISFPHVAGSIAAQGGRERFDPVVDHPYGAVNTALLVVALKDEWSSYNDLKIDELPILLTVHYRDFSRTFKFTTTCTLVFLPYEEIIRHAPENQKPVIVVRDFKHKKEPDKT